jgi:hypothetical protein
VIICRPCPLNINHLYYRRNNLFIIVTILGVAETFPFAVYSRKPSSVPEHAGGYL